MFDEDKSEMRWSIGLYVDFFIKFDDIYSDFVTICMYRWQCIFLFFYKHADCYFKKKCCVILVLVMIIFIIYILEFSLSDSAASNKVGEADWRLIGTAFYIGCIFLYFFPRDLRFFFSFPNSFFSSVSFGGGWSGYLLFSSLLSLSCLSLSFSSLLSLSYLETCLMLRPIPFQFPPPPLLVEICSLVSGRTMWMFPPESASNP